MCEVGYIKPENFKEIEKEIDRTAGRTLKKQRDIFKYNGHTHCTTCKVKLEKGGEYRSDFFFQDHCPKCGRLYNPGG